jgi:hypothetical protein
MLNTISQHNVDKPWQALPISTGQFSSLTNWLFCVKIWQGKLGPGFDVAVFHLNTDPASYNQSKT